VLECTYFRKRFNGNTAKTVFSLSAHLGNCDYSLDDPFGDECNPLGDIQKGSQ
jgi:hypothetical protein